MKLSTLRKSLSQLEKQSTELQKKVAKRALREFKGLAASVGLKSIDALILELIQYRALSASGRRTKVSISEAAKQVAAGGRKRLSESQKKAIKGELKAGELTSAALAGKYGVSTASVNAWKKAWGLTKRRSG